MKELVQEKEKAITLRKKGLSYNEILRQIPVAKSSLSLWLKDLPLTEQEKAVLKDRKNSNISRGRIKAAAVNRSKRLERESVWVKEASDIFTSFSSDPMFHAGIVMYWAEGSKTDTRWMLINTDPDVIELMISWLSMYLKVSHDIIYGSRLA